MTAWGPPWELCSDELQNNNNNNLVSQNPAAAKSLLWLWEAASRRGHRWEQPRTTMSQGGEGNLDELLCHLGFGGRLRSRIGCLWHTLGLNTCSFSFLDFLMRSGFLGPVRSKKKTHEAGPIKSLYEFIFNFVSQKETHTHTRGFEWCWSAQSHKTYRPSFLTTGRLFCSRSQVWGANAASHVTVAWLWSLRDAAETSGLWTTSAAAFIWVRNSGVNNFSPSAAVRQQWMLPSRESMKPEVF